MSFVNAVAGIAHHPEAQAVGWALLHFVWQGALIGAISAVVLWLLRSTAADVRYVVATIGLSVMFTMPVVTAVQLWRASRRVAAKPPQPRHCTSIRRCGATGGAVSSECRAPACE